MLFAIETKPTKTETLVGHKKVKENIIHKK